MKLLWTILATLVLASSLYAQEQTQTIRGKITDKLTLQPLFGVSVKVLDSDPIIGTSSDMDGNFVLENVPIGRQTLQASYMGYAVFNTDNFIVSIAKEPYIEIAMSEAAHTTGTVEVSATGGSGGTAPNLPLNELSVVSTRSFSVEETQRYPSSINDPGRMALAFPGVQSNSDNENDATIRGNSAAGVLWRLEGLDLENPNHFARPGTTAGGITVFSASLLGNSDFSTGAFAAEYGNAFAGVFDMRFRKGNLNNQEYTIRAGVVGLDFSTEGPIKKGRSSYIINYRYSTLGILGAAGLYVVRDNVRNTFQDLSFNIYLNTPNNKTSFMIFGVGGLSAEHWFVKDSSEWQTSWDYIRNPNYANLGILGMSMSHLIDDKSFLKLTVGGTVNQILDYQDDASFDAVLRPLDEYNVTRNYLDNETLDSIRVEVNDFVTARITAHLTYNRKLSDVFNIKVGMINTARIYDLDYQLYQGPQVGLFSFLDDAGMTYFGQAYAQASWRATEKLTINFGTDALYLGLNNTFAIGPRAAIKYQIKPKTSLSFAYGWHNKALPEGTYLLNIQDSLGNITQPNRNLKMTGSHHFILAFEQIVGKSLRLRIEPYYQYLFNVPVGTNSTGSFSDFWYYDLRDNYGNIAMTDEGVGRNYGVDVSVEKFFGKNFFLLCTGSIFRSQAKTLRNEWTSTKRDSRYISSLMGGVELPIQNGEKGVFQMGAKMFINGNLRYTPADTVASLAAGFYIPDSERAYEGSFSENDRFGYFPYLRLDTRIAYRRDGKRMSYTIALDIQNTTNMQNKASIAYDRQLNELIYRYHAGILPVLSFQLDFR